METELLRQALLGDPHPESDRLQVLTDDSLKITFHGGIMTTRYASVDRLLSIEPSKGWVRRRQERMPEGGHIAPVPSRTSASPAIPRRYQPNMARLCRCRYPTIQRTAITAATNATTRPRIGSNQP